MTTTSNNKIAFIDGSRLITEACVQAGAEVFVGYPITPANLLYSYSNQRFPVMMAAPDEITTLQWMTGFAALGKLPVTATAFPGYALMIESINMAMMMELPMVIILVQRLGPATGTATSGAQGDINGVYGTISGGFKIPTFCISNLQDCWELTVKAVEAAIRLRTPVVLLSSKEMVMTQMSFDLSGLPDIEKVAWKLHDENQDYKTYSTDEQLIPAFLPITQNRHQVRFTASTHDKSGILQNTSPEALANSTRLKTKLDLHINDYLFYSYDDEKEAETIVFSFDITAQASREAVFLLRQEGYKVSLLIAKTLFPIPEIYPQILSNYKKIVVAEENLDGQYKHLLFGSHPGSHIKSVNAFGRMIQPEEIMEEVKNNG
jgi:2-oxoglutarate ferredoxin oxidoreductase subunit alpha